MRLTTPALPSRTRRVYRRSRPFRRAETNAVAESNSASSAIAQACSVGMFDGAGSTIVRVVLPTSLAGVVTGVTLAVARVIGETAPLLIIAGSTDSTNTNLFAERMMTLPVFIYYSYTQPGIPPEFGQARAWGAALVLIAIVMALNLVARLVGYFFSPKTRS